ncbi:MAG: hypothetical protein ABI855_06425 [Bacteroidota bacterium]
MKKQPAVRHYKFSDAFLKQRCDDGSAVVMRDQSEFTPRGITAADNTAFLAQSEAFGEIPDDEELQGDIGTAVENKDAAAELLRVKIRSVRTMAENKWGDHAARFRTYDFKDMSELPDDDLVKLGKRVSRVGNKQLVDLASEGLDAAFLTALDVLVTDLDRKIDFVKGAEENRDIATEDRIEAGNALYKVLVRFCNTGKDIWINRDEAKYNDYVIYDTPSGGPEPPIVP